MTETSAHVSKWSRTCVSDHPEEETSLIQTDNNNNMDTNHSTCDNAGKATHSKPVRGRRTVHHFTVLMIANEWVRLGVSGLLCNDRSSLLHAELWWKCDECIMKSRQQPHTKQHVTSLPPRPLTQHNHTVFLSTNPRKLKHVTTHHYHRCTVWDCEPIPGEQPPPSTGTTVYNQCVYRNPQCFSSRPCYSAKSSNEDISGLTGDHPV